MAILPAPGNVLTFASGSTAAQSFTVRVYDDADVEAVETAIIDFTVNNGGGDASEGTTTPTFTITLFQTMILHQPVLHPVLSPLALLPRLSLRLLLMQDSRASGHNLYTGPVN